LGAFAPSCVIAQNAADDWKFAASLYGWAPDIGGQVQFPSGAAGTIDVDVGAILEHLKMTAQGSFEARKGRWSVFTDVIYLDVGDSSTRTRNLELAGRPLPAGVTAAMDFDLKSLFLTLAAGYRVAQSDNATLDVLLGARYARFEETFDWEFTGSFGATTPPPLTGVQEATIDHWDAIAGVRGRFTLGAGHNWIVPYQFDVGTGDSESSWHAMVGLGYAFGWGDVERLMPTGRFTPIQELSQRCTHSRGRASFQQLPRHRRLALPMAHNRVVERRVPASVLTVGVRAKTQQQFHDRQISRRRGVVQ